MNNFWSFGCILQCCPCEAYPEISATKDNTDKFLTKPLKAKWGQWYSSTKNDVAIQA